MYCVVLCDQDGDGKLGYDDVAWLMKATLTPPDDAWSSKNHDEVCAVVGAADKLITKEQFFASYETRLASIEEVQLRVCVCVCVW